MIEGNCKEHTEAKVGEELTREKANQEFVDGELYQLQKKYPKEFANYILLSNKPQGKLIFVECGGCGSPKLMVAPDGKPLCIQCIIAGITNGDLLVEHQ